jgi:MazG family protein
LSKVGDSSFNPASAEFERLCQIVARLRAPGGCPWDREQTNESILPQLIEEAYELAGAVRANDSDNFREELGDLLLHIVMHAEIARESGGFDIASVVKNVADKLVRRHPHVFGNSHAPDAGAVVRQWEKIKHFEKGAETHYLASLPDALPALVRAQKAQKKVARVNFDWSDPQDVVRKIEEELGEAKDALETWRQSPGDKQTTNEPSRDLEDEIGDLLFAVVNLARKCHIDAEAALQKATDKFRERFNRVEDEVKARRKQLGEADLAELDEIWEEVKKQTLNAERRTSNAE